MKINEKETISKLGQIMNMKVLAVAENVIDRIEGFEREDLFDEICQAVDDELIYTEDQWDIISNYIDPADIGNVSFCDIINEFIEDIYNNCVVEYE
jgi:hypothetical protein